MKIGIIGCGNVGSSCAYACVLREVGTELVLIDDNKAFASAQAEDILHATPFAKAMPVGAGEYEDLRDAGIIMIAAGAHQKSGETRLDLLKRNVEVFAAIIPRILKAAPQAVILIATNPVDIMTHFTAHLVEKHGGNKDRVIGSGTILDTARFKALIAQHLSISSHSVHANVLGEHGDSEVLHWSGASVSNIQMEDFCRQAGRPLTDKTRSDIDDAVRHAAYRIIEGKGATWYGIGAGMARIAQAIIEDEHALLTCSAPVDKILDIENVTLSLPRVISSKGVVKTFRPDLDDGEQAALRRSAHILKQAIDSLEEVLI